MLRGAFRAPIDLAGVKVVGDYVDNYKQGLPSEIGLLLLFDPRNGVPKAIIDGSHLTDMRTGAVTAIGAKYLARKDVEGSRPCRRARHGLLERAPARPAVRVRRDPRAFAPAGEPRRLRRAARARSRQAGDGDAATGATCVEGADIVVEASRLAEPEPMLKTEWIKPGAFVVPYGTMSAVELSLTDIMDKIVVDDWGQCKAGQFGALRAHVEAGKLSEATLHAEMGEIVAGQKAGPRARRRDHPVLAPRPVALRHRAGSRDAGEGGAARASGQRLRYA